MSPKNMKWLAAAGAMSALGFSFASADYHMAHGGMDNHGAMFSARGSETTKITFGGQFQAGFMYVDADKGGANGATTATSNTDEQFVNFTINHLRLMTKADLAGDWTVLSNIDFMKENADANGIEEKLSNDTSGAGIFIDKAYVQKVWNDHTFQLGYKKVAFGYEQNTAETELLAIERSATTNFFTQLGSDLNSRRNGTTGNQVYESRQDRGFAGRKIGIHVNGAFDLQDDYSIGYNVALTNGYSGASFYSTQGSDVPAIFAGLDYGFMVNEFDMMLGLNFGFVAEGANGVKNQGNVWGLNPYFAMDYENFGLVFEFFYGQIDDGKRDADAADWGKQKDANPYGFLITPSYRYENFEFVGRFGYTDTDKFGTTVQNALGMPVANSDTGHWSRMTFYDEFYHIYVGMNYYMMDRAVKASIGYEYLKFDDALKNAVFNSEGSSASPTPAGSPKVHSLRTALQLVF